MSPCKEVGHCEQVLGFGLTVRLGGDFTPGFQEANLPLSAGGQVPGGARSGLSVSRPGYSGRSASCGGRLPHPVLPHEMGPSLAQLLLTVLPLPPVSSVSLTSGALGESGLLSPRAAARPPGQVPRAWCPVHLSSSGSLRAFGPYVTKGRGDVWGSLGCAPTNGSPFVPQLMRMVLNESLKALKTRGWEERSVSQRVLTLLTGESGFVSLGVGFMCFSLNYLS